MRTGAIIGTIAAALLSSIIGLIAWSTDPIKFSWFVAPGEIFSFICLRGDNYANYRDMARHGIPASIAFCTLFGFLLGGVVGLMTQHRDKSR
jgi:hypothetical protein